MDDPSSGTALTPWQISILEGQPPNLERKWLCYLVASSCTLLKEKNVWGPRENQELVGKAPEENVFWMPKRLSVSREMSATFGNLSNIQFTFLKRLTIPLEQWFSNTTLHRNSLGGLIKTHLLPSSPKSFWLSSSGAEPENLETRLWEQLLQIRRALTAGKQYVLS